jgi:V-type H+-transporting ATPase subunit a
MGELWRSKEMQLVQIIVHNDAASAIVNKMGEGGMVEIRDLNAGTAFNKRTFYEEVKKCDDLDATLQNIGGDLTAHGLTPSENIPELVMPLDAIEPKIRAFEVELASLKASQDLLKKNHNALIEQRHVLNLGKKFYAGGARATGVTTSASEQEMMPLSDFGVAGPGTLGQVSGMIRLDLVEQLERIIFRATRGNAVFKQEQVSEQLLETDGKGVTHPVDKAFFMIFFSGDVLRDKVSKICSYFGAILYKFPSVLLEQDEMLIEVEKRIIESDTVKAGGDAVMMSALGRIAETYGTWRTAVIKEKMVFNALNQCEFDLKRHVFIMEGWVPCEQFDDVVEAMNDAVTESGLDTTPIVNRLKSRLTPPTYIPVNKFTSGFQALVNTYGTPRYREANPGAFCVILFPYLFGIMFGDFGHGLMLAMLGYYFISKEKEWDGKPMSDMLEMIYGGRYILLLNGLFGAFSGLMYNEAFAFPMAWFGPTHYADSISGGECSGSEEEDHGACVQVGGNYPVGVDPLWHYCQNSVKISFFNSLKMKISIVVGVIQMSLGIFISLLNHLEYKDYKKVFFQFIPEWIFFQGIFGYLVFCIFLKWATNWNDESNPQPPPSLLTMLINMFMSPTSPITEPLYDIQCYGGDSTKDYWLGLCPEAKANGACSQSHIAEACPVSCGGIAEDLDNGFFDKLREASDPRGEFKLCFSETQSSIQFSLLIAAFVAVPFLLLPIPFIEMYQHSKAQKYKELGEEAEGDHGGHGEHGEEFSLGDAFIHQGIHTIEFVLGSISNTASYLRLWALSLAHTQLAELFMDMILSVRGLNGNVSMSPMLLGEEGAKANPTASVAIHVFMLFLTYAVWTMCTFVVLMVMENLSSFLHALRLQWVEFQNKFFYGDGQRYAPFTFKNIGSLVSSDED